MPASEMTSQCQNGTIISFLRTPPYAPIYEIFKAVESEWTKLQLTCNYSQICLFLIYTFTLLPKFQSQQMRWPRLIIPSQTTCVGSDHCTEINYRTTSMRRMTIGTMHWVKRGLLMSLRHHVAAVVASPTKRASNDGDVVAIATDRAYCCPAAATTFQSYRQLRYYYSSHLDWYWCTIDDTARHPTF